jgi:undecaprenyl-diphosphatase
MSTIVQAALLGVVQGLTEFLPVSSTAHLLIGERLLGFSDPGSVFTEMIQLGSIFAIMWLYRAKILDVVTGLTTQPEARRFTLVLFIAFLPAVIVAALGSDYIESVLHKSIPVIAAAFILGGIAILVVERFGPRPTVHKIDDVTIGRGAGIGLFQTLALIPGVSRSGATIVGGMLVGLDRPTAAEFSFFLAMPTLAAAFAHSALKLRHQITPDRLTTIAVGFVMAFISSILVVKPFLNIVRRRGFAPFAWYRIIAGIALLAAVRWGYL